MTRDLAPHYWSVAQLRQAYADGGFSPADAVRACLERISRVDPTLHAFIRTQYDEAQAQAARAAAGPDTPLQGVPYSLKDNFDVAGLPTTCHSKPRAYNTAQSDSDAYAALKQAGAILLGKNSMHELATGGPSFDLPWPPARNPWNTALHPGGSSSGSGAAVASGMSYFSLGSDTGGSVRHPATACGIFGFKPSYGAISSQGVVPLSIILDHPGVLARSCRDIAIVMAALAAAPAQRHCYASLARQGPSRNLREFAVGVIDAFSTDLEADSEIAAAFENMVAALGQAGCRVTRIHVDPLRRYATAARGITAAQAYSYYGAQIEARPTDFGARTRTRIGQGKNISAEQYAMLLGERRFLTAQMNDALGAVDVAMALSSLHFPCKISDGQAIDATYDKQARTPFNLTGLPALAVPTGVSRTGLPAGIQFAASSAKELQLLEFSMALEAEGLSRFVAPPETGLASR